MIGGTSKAATSRPLNSPRARSDRQSDRNGREPELPPRLERRHHAGHERRHRADGQVDSPRHQDGRHSKRQDQNRRRVDDQIVEIPAERLLKRRPRNRTARRSTAPARPFRPASRQKVIETVSSPGLRFGQRHRGRGPAWPAWTSDLGPSHRSSSSSFRLRLSAQSMLMTARIAPPCTAVRQYSLTPA